MLIMDLICHLVEPYTFDLIFPASWPNTDITRQFIEMFLVLAIGGELFYFFSSGVDYVFFYDKTWLSHKKMLKNQISREVFSATTSAPFIAMLMTPFMVAEWRGYSKLYEDPSANGGVWGMLLSIALFILWTDFAIYWIHRFLHTFPSLYKYVHKEHHVWIIPTPWAAIAFHPLDGWAQELPYLAFPFLWPLQKHLYIVLYVFILSWTVSIHDRINVVDNYVINSAAHHDLHHRKFDYNYGQYFTFWDRIGGSHMDVDLSGQDKDALPPASSKKTQ